MIHDLILLLAGVVVGTMNAIAGGGMLVGFPIMLALGIPALTANASANFIVLPGNLAATFSYRRYLKRVPRAYLLLVIPAIIGATLGALLLRHTSFSDFNKYIPWLMLFAVGMFIFQPFLYKQVHKRVHGTKKERSRLKPILFMGLPLLVLSIYGGYFGAGFGFIMLAFLGFTKLHDHIHRMNALKTIVTICISAVSLLCLLSSHLINWRVAMIMASGNLAGGIFGAKVAQTVSSHALRLVVISIGVITASILIVQTH
jgi:uncharacterized membrane protein YfcA